MSGLLGGKVLFLILLQLQKLMKSFVRIAWLFSRFLCNCIALLLFTVLVKLNNIWFFLMLAPKWRSFQFFKRGNGSTEDPRAQAIITQASLLMYMQYLGIFDLTILVNFSPLQIVDYAKMIKFFKLLSFFFYFHFRLLYLLLLAN